MCTSRVWLVCAWRALTTLVSDGCLLVSVEVNSKMGIGKGGS